MKIKTQKKIILGILFVIFWLSTGVFAQYYYFDNGGKVYQQGCSGTLNVRVNANGKDISAGIFNLLLDPTTTIYPHTTVVSELQDFFQESAEAFLFSTSPSSSPTWVSGSNYTILYVDRNNGNALYNGSNGLYGIINFKPQYNINTYDIVFGMNYIPGENNTRETTLSYDGADVINPSQQEDYRTGTFAVLQEPCVADTKVPTIANVSIANRSTQISHLSGLSFSLKDEGGQNGVSNVPYIWSGGVWTGNVGGTITNQYGIDLTRGTVTLVGNGNEKVIALNAVGVGASGYKKTWQDNWLNFDVSIPSSLLFDFGVEKTISLVIWFYDRAGNTGYYAKTFNSPQGPTLISGSRSPANEAVYVNLRDPIKLGIKDDWAGVDSGTIQITLSGILGTNYGPYTFSGTDLNLSGIQGEANQPDYYINISNHEIFPTSGTIRVSVYAKDMEGTVDTISDYAFFTRPNCSEFQCCDPVLLDLGDGSPISYTNTGLIISGGVNPTFSGDEQNITGVIDCNTEDEGLSVYSNTGFMFFTDDDEITINGTGVMGVLSGNVLTLSYIIDHVETIIDAPSSGEILTTGDAEIQWHLTGMDDYEWLSGYYIEIYSGDTPITGGFVDGTGIMESLSDGEYEFIVYPVDFGGRTGSAATGNFSIDTSVPSVVITGTDIGMCSPAGTLYVVTGTFSEAVTGISASTLTVSNGTVQSFQKIPDLEAVWTVRGASTGNGVLSVNVATGAVNDLAGNTNSTGTEVLSWNYDGAGPEFTLDDIEVEECNTGYMTISGVTQVGCASGDVSPYSWDLGLNWGITGTDSAYSGGIGEKIMTVRVRDAFGNYTEKTGKYIWTNVNPSVEDISVGNVGLGTGINWRELSHAQEGACGTGTIEFSGFISTGSHGICTEESGIITYIPNLEEQYEGEDSCIFEIKDDDGYTVTGEITFTGVDTKRPTVTLEGGVGEVCTSGDTFIVTGTFTEDVEGVTINTLTGENVNIVGFTGEGDVYGWTVKMEGGTGRVWINSGEVSDIIGNENVGSEELILGNYDIYGASGAILSYPINGETSYSKTIELGWSEAEDEGCAGMSGYIWEVCSDELCEDVIKSGSTEGTGGTAVGLDNGTGYWRVISEDVYGNTGVSEIRSFVVDSNDPNCWIVEQPTCTTGNVLLTMTGDKNMTVVSGGGIEWRGGGKYYTGEATEVGNILVTVDDGNGHTGQCEINVTKHDAEGPEITQVTGVTYECEGTTIEITANDTGCAGISGYKFGLEFGDGDWQVGNTLGISSGAVGRTGGIKEQEVTVEDTLGNSSKATGYVLEIKDREPTFDSGDYGIGLITGNIGGIDIISEMGAREGACGTEDLTVGLGECTNASGEITNGILEIEPNEGVEENGECEVYLEDNEGSRVTGYVRYEVDTQAPSCEIVYDITGTTNQDVTATLSCSGVSGEDWFVTTGEVTLTGDGEVIFEYEDENGNTGSVTGMVDWIDKTKPECTGVIYSVTGGTSGDVTVTFDTGSCSENVTLITGNGITGEDYVFTGNGEITFIYEDEAGNTGELVVEVGPDGEGEVWIDKETPTCRIDVPDVWTNTGVTLSIIRVEGDDVEGYRWEGEEWMGMNSGKNVEGNGVYTGYVRDEVWNVGMCTGEVTKVDKEAPGIELSWTNEEACTSGNTYTVTGEFDEIVEGFTGSDVTVVNGEISNFAEVVSGQEYTWTVIMYGGELEMYVSTGAATDRAGNGNNESNRLTGSYDNEGPNGITMVRPNTGSSTNYGSTLVLQWNEVEDQGCSELSGYVYKVCEDINCVTVVSGGTTNGTGVEIGDLVEGETYYWIVYPEDNYGNTGESATGDVLIDLTRISCRIEERECSTTGTTLHMLVDGSGTHLSWTGFASNEMVEVGEGEELTKEVTETGTVMCYVYDEETGRTGSNEYTIGGIDRINPTVEEVIEATGYECTYITGVIELGDEGCGEGEYSYVWNNGEETGNNMYTLMDTGATGYEIVVTGYDGVMNSVSTGVMFRWYNSPIEANNFTGNDNVGNTGRSVDWKELSNVSDGACGSGTIEIKGIVEAGTHGICTTGEGDMIIYTPDITVGYTGEDSCEIEVEDDEWDTGSIVISWGGIDTEKPSCILTVQEGQDCTSGTVTLSLSSESEDVEGYSFDGENRREWTGPITTGRNAKGTYTGYVKDAAGNISDPCTVEVTGGILDLDEPGLETMNWIGYECSTGIIIVTGTDNSCGISGLNYLWSWLGNTTNTNEIYSENVGSQTVNVTAFDGVGHSITSQVTYTWQNVPVTGSGFTVENVGTGITVDWYASGNVSAGSCESGDITASINTGTCEISGHEIIYTPIKGVEGGESCTITITDEDEEGSGDIEIEITFTGVDTKRPTVTLEGGVGEVCTSGDTYIVTGTFTEDVEGVTINTLTGENVDIVGFTGEGDVYGWTVKMEGGTGRVWILTGGITDGIGNELITGDEKILGNYDNLAPIIGSLISPDSGQTVLSTSFTFEWNESVDQGCAGGITYILQICEDEDCENADSYPVSGTGRMVGSLENGTGYWRVISKDAYGNTGATDIQNFVVDAREPTCSIEPLQMCTTGNVGLVLTVDRDVTIENSGGVEWIGSGMNYTGEISENGEIVVVVRDVAVVEYTGRCEINVTGHDVEGPEITQVTGVTYECEGTTIEITANDTGCAGISGYKFGLEFGDGDWQVGNTLGISSGAVGRTGGIKEQEVTVEDTLGNSSKATGYVLEIKDREPTFDSGDYGIGLITGNIGGIDIISEMGAREGACGTEDLTVGLGECTNASGEITNGILEIEPNEGVEENGVCEVYVEDNEGSRATGYVRYEVDTQAPSCEIVYDITGTTNQDVTATLSCSGVNGEDWFVTTGEVTLTGDGEVIFEYEDENGNTGSVTGMVDRIDKTAPECSIEYSPDSPTSGDVVATLTGCSELVSVTNNDGITYTFTDTGTFIFEFVDDAGNTGVSETIVNWIDKEAPSCEVIISPDEWTNTGVVLSMNVIGDATGYSWNDVDRLGTNTGLFVESIGIYTGYVRDEVGNLGMCTGEVMNIDKESPTIVLEGTNVSGCTSEATFVVTGSFSESGIVGFTQDKIHIESGEISDFVEVVSGQQYTWTVTMTGGELVLYVETGAVVDKAGNKNDASNILTSNYDNIGPGSVNVTRPSDGINYGSTLILQWDEVEDQGCSELSGYVYKVCDNSDCTGVIYSGATNLTGVEIENLGTGTYYWTIYPEDNYGNTGDETTGQVFVDLTRIGCRFEEIPLCSNTGITLSMFIDGSGTHLSWTGEGYWEPVTSLSIEVTEPWFSITGYVYDEETNRTGYCEYTVSSIDIVDPSIISVTYVTGYECETITGSVGITDEGCGSGTISYIWDGLDGTNNSGYGIFSESGNIDRIIYVTGTDGVGNTVTTGVQFAWLNSPISGNDFTGNDNVGNTGRSVNWKELSNASDGVCGSGTIHALEFIDSGSKGECVVEGDIVTYTPHEGQTGSDTCVLKIEDDEWDTGSIVIAWEGIDTEKPSCILATGQETQSCTSGTVTLSLSSESEDVEGYSFDGENRREWIGTTTTGTNIIGTYTGYVKDAAGNISDPCTVEVTGGILDLDEPGLETMNWTGYECSTGSITVTGTDNSCGLSGLNYLWSWLGNTTNTNEIYSENVGSQTVEVTVFDGVGHSTGRQVTYTWQNIPVTGNSFIVENVGTGITVDWFVNANVSGGICELDDITATIEGSGSCEIRGHDIIYTPTEGVAGEETCTVIITDGDEGEGGGTGIEIEITFTGVDTEKPTVGLQGGIGEQCTNENIFTVIGVFDEVVQGVNIGTLTGENVNIVDFTGNEDIYEWTVEMQGGTGRVWILTGGITDNVGNELITGDEKILGNYDNEIPQGVSLLMPGTGQEFNRRTIDFEWTVSSDEGCAGLSGYIVNVCKDSSCNDVVETIFTENTGVTIPLQDNDDYYWRVIPVDNNGNGNTGVSREFSVQSDEPVCSIVSSECSSSPISLILTGNKEIFIVSGNVTWQQVSPAVYAGEISENIDVRAIVKDSDGQTGYCHTGVETFDNVGPDFEFGTIEVDEGQPLNITIVANDTGCAEISGYSFGTEFGLGEWQISSGLSITAEQIGNIGGIEKDQVVSVIDTLGNITTKTGKIVIKDVKPTITQTGTIDGVQTGEVIVDVIDLLGAEEGDLGTGDLEVEIDECIYATGYVSGHNLIVNVEDGVEGVGYCTVKVKDNEGSYADVDGVIEFEVDTKEPVCTGLVFSPAGWTSGDSVSVSLTRCSEPIYSGDTTFVFTGNGDHTFEVEDDMGNTGEIVVHFTGFDREAPNFDFNNNSGYECQTGILTISNAIDTGIGLADSPYSFDGTTRNTLNTKQIYSGGAGEIRIPGYVRDKLGNYKVVQAGYVFNDSKPTATGFSIYALSGIEVNWKDLSNASDGACGSGKLIASVSGGTASGNCSISGDMLLYEPEITSTTLINTCDLIISDDEGSSVKITVEIKGINNYPDVELVTPINGLVLDPGNVKFAWRGQGNSEVIDKYVYNIWSSNDDYTVEQTGLEVSIDLKPGAYNWNVYAKYIDATTGGLSDTYSFNVVAGNSGLAKDKCPNGDFSDSFYDGRCDPSGSHSAADICGTASSTYSDELKGAYVYAYSYGITTMCPIESANLDGYLIRSHFAKMISEFAVNVLGKKPEKGKTGCDKFNDIDGLNKELHDFVITSCELNLMGQESDGVTPAKSFNPNDYVTRAQFGTVLSRLLFGDVYNIKDESKVYMNEGFWYKNHLEALKNYGIMTKIDGNWPNTLERRGRVMLMLERADEYGIFAGKIPAKNGIKALFDE